MSTPPPPPPEGPRIQTHILGEILKELQRISKFEREIVEPTAYERASTQQAEALGRQRTSGGRSDDSSSGGVILPQGYRPPVAREPGKASEDSLQSLAASGGDVPTMRIPAETAGPGGVRKPVGFFSRTRQAIRGNEAGQRGISGWLNPDVEVQVPGGVSPFASRPMDPAQADQYGRMPTPFSGMSRAETGRAVTENLRIPQYGDWQLDTNLRQARDLAARVAMRGYDVNPDTQEITRKENAPWYTDSMTNVTSGLSIAYSNAANMKRLQMIGGAALNAGSGMQQFGAALGYSPNSGGLGSSTILGFRNPLSLIPGLGNAATQAGWQAEKLKLLLRTHAGISGDAAGKIVDSLAAEGFSGGTANRLASNLSVPLVQQGLSPEVASQFANATRYGNVGINDLAKTLGNLGQIARETRQPINTAAESLLAFSQVAQSMGATPGQAYKTGQQFSTATGMDPQVLGTAMENPLFKGMMMSQYGVMPSAIGATDGGTLTQNLLQTLHMSMQATSGLNRPVYRTIDGHRRMVLSGYDAQVAQAAQLAGIDVNQARTLLRYSDRSGHAADAETLLAGPQGWQAEYDQLTHHGKIKLSQHARQELMHGKAGQGGLPSSWVSQDEILRISGQAGVDKKNLASFGRAGKEHPLDRFQGDIEGALRAAGAIQAKDQTPTLALKFTGPAAKFFQQDMQNSKLLQNAGQGPLTAQRATAPAWGISGR